MDIEAQKPANFESLSADVAQRLETVSTHVVTIRKTIALPDNRGATPLASRRLKTAVDEGAEELKRISPLVRWLTNWEVSELSATQKFKQDKLAKEFGAILNEFRSLQQQAIAKEKQWAQAARVALEDESKPATERTPLMGSSGSQQKQAQVLDTVNQDELNLQTTLIEDREHEIQGIERGVAEINAIFKDLGTLVGEQGAQLDSVEENISNFATNTENASKQLLRASESQKKRRYWSCFVLVVLLVVLGVILLAVLA